MTANNEGLAQLLGAGQCGSENLARLEAIDMMTAEIHAKQKALRDAWLSASWNAGLARQEIPADAGWLKRLLSKLWLRKRTVRTKSHSELSQQVNDMWIACGGTVAPDGSLVGQDEVDRRLTWDYARALATWRYDLEHPQPPSVVKEVEVTETSPALVGMTSTVVVDENLDVCLLPAGSMSAPTSDSAEKVVNEEQTQGESSISTSTPPTPATDTEQHESGVSAPVVEEKAEETKPSDVREDVNVPAQGTEKTAQPTDDGGGFDTSIPYTASVPVLNAEKEVDSLASVAEDEADAPPVLSVSGNDTPGLVEFEEQSKEKKAAEERTLALESGSKKLERGLVYRIEDEYLLFVGKVSVVKDGRKIFRYDFQSIPDDGKPHWFSVNEMGRVIELTQEKIRAERYAASVEDAEVD